MVSLPKTDSNDMDDDLKSSFVITWQRWASPSQHLLTLLSLDSEGEVLHSLELSYPYDMLTRGKIVGKLVPIMEV